MSREEMTNEEAIKHLKLMQSGARYAIRFKKNDKEISEEERKEDIEIYQDQLEALNVATKALEQKPKMGHWIENAPEYQNIEPPYICSECGHSNLIKTNYCEQCGAKMESEDKE